MSNRDDVLQVIHETCGILLEIISDELTLADDLGLDSLERIELCIALESRFGREIDVDVWDRVQTVGDVITLCSDY